MTILEYSFQNLLTIRIHVLVVYSQDPQSETHENFLSGSIVAELSAVDSAVELDDKPLLRTVEVCNKECFPPLILHQERMLSQKFPSSELSISQCRPETLLRFGLPFAQIAGNLDGDLFELG